jgi:hypothetical protein
VDPPTHDFMESGLFPKSFAGGRTLKMSKSGNGHVQRMIAAGFVGPFITIRVRKCVPRQILNF